MSLCALHRSSIKWFPNIIYAILWQVAQFVSKFFINQIIQLCRAKFFLHHNENGCKLVNPINQSNALFTYFYFSCFCASLFYVINGQHRLLFRKTQCENFVQTSPLRPKQKKTKHPAMIHAPQQRHLIGRIRI